MPKKSILKYKNYDVHSITTTSLLGKVNANIATWVMQSAMQGKFLTIALDKTDYTIQLVRETMILNVNLLAQDQAKKLISKLGRKSGLTSNKFVNLPFEIDERGCPYLTESIGYVQCQCVGSIDSGDHEVFVCEVLKQVTLNPEKQVLTNNYLRDYGLVRG